MPPPSSPMTPNWPASASPPSSTRCGSARSCRTPRRNYGEYARALADEILGLRAAGRAADQPFPAPAGRGLLGNPDRRAGEVRPRGPHRHRQPDGPHPRRAAVPRHDQAARLCHAASTACREAEFDDHVAEQQALSRRGWAPRTRPPPWPRPAAMARCWPAMTTPTPAQVAQSAPATARISPSFPPRSRPPAPATTMASR